MSNSTIISNLSRTADRALALANDIAADLLQHDGVKVEFKTNPHLANDIEYADKVFSTGALNNVIHFTTARFAIGGHGVDLEVISHGRLSYKVRITAMGGGYRKEEVRESKNLTARAIGSKIHEVIAQIKAHVESMERHKQMEMAGEKIAAEIKPALNVKRPGMLWSPELRVHTGNDAPVFALTLTLTEDHLRKVAAFLATL